MTKLDTESFITISRQVHGNIYDYSCTVVYTQSTAKVQIRCPTHGLFEQYASSHMRGSGCRSCGFERSANRKRNRSKTRVTFNEILVRAASVHNNAYTYKLDSAHIRTSDSIEITCPYSWPIQPSFEKPSSGRTVSKMCTREQNQSESIDS